MTLDEIAKRVSELEVVRSEAHEVLGTISRNLRTHYQAMLAALQRGDVDLGMTHMSVAATEWLPLQTEAWERLLAAEREMMSILGQVNAVIGEMQEQIAAALMDAPLRVH